MSTLDQQRAQFAWDAANAARRAFPKFEEYKNLAKGAPALVMGNGLMAALAFYQSRDKAHATQLLKDMLGWLARRAGEKATPPFAAAMGAFQTMNSQDYMAATDEVLAMLKWLRQFADALDKGAGGAQ
jgi:CRISPR-associated protein Cmr5